MTPAPPPQSRSGLGGLALIAAWLVLLGVLAAAAGYIVMLPEAQVTGSRGESAIALNLPPAAAPAEKPSESGAAKTAPAEIPKAAAPEVAAPQGDAQTAKQTPPAAGEAAPEVALAETRTAAQEPVAATPAAAESVDRPAEGETQATPEIEREAEPETAAAAEEARQPETGPAPDAEAAEAAQPGEAQPGEAQPGETQPGETQAGETQAGETQEAALPKPLPPGRRPLWLRNSQPFDGSDGRPRIAVVLTGLGLSSAATESAIKLLPPAVTLSFTPYSRKLNQWVALARVNGHEVMLDLPMEPTSYPDDDPGPLALLTALSPRQNVERLRWTLDRTTGYVGVATVMGSRFTASESHLEPILQELKDRGVLFLDNRSSERSVAGALAARIGAPRAINDRALDRAQASRIAIDARLVQLEGIALAEGSAVAMGRPYPVTIERLREWVKDLNQRGFVLAPITAVADRQEVPETTAQNSQAQ